MNGSFPAKAFRMTAASILYILTGAMFDLEFEFNGKKIVDLFISDQRGKQSLSLTCWTWPDTVEDVLGTGRNLQGC